MADKHDHVSKCMHGHRNNTEQGARSLALFVSVHVRHLVSEKAAGCTSVRLNQVNVSAPTEQLERSWELFINSRGLGEILGLLVS